MNIITTTKYDFGDTFYKVYNNKIFKGVITGIYIKKSIEHEEDSVEYKIEFTSRASSHSKIELIKEAESLLTYEIYTSRSELIDSLE